VFERKAALVDQVTALNGLIASRNCLHFSTSFFESKSLPALVTLHEKSEWQCDCYSQNKNCLDAGHSPELPWLPKNNREDREIHYNVYENTITGGYQERISPIELHSDKPVKENHGKAKGNKIMKTQPPGVHNVTPCERRLAKNTFGNKQKYDKRVLPTGKVIV
jgi:hypothetical protein